jgi:hypothetical protein
VRRGANSLTIIHEVSLRECVAGAGLQKPLEAHCHPFGPELDAHIDEPRPPWSRGPILPSIVRVQARRDIGGDADVAPVWMAQALDDVDESLGRVAHAGFVSELRANVLTCGYPGYTARNVSGFAVIDGEMAEQIAETAHLRLERSLRSLATVGILRGELG